MINTIINQKFQDQFSERQIVHFCETTLKFYGEITTDITVVIDSDGFIQSLNRKYRNIDHATDVLSFDIDHVDPETGRRYLGDIIISGDTVARSAITNGVTQIEEIRLLIVHGILHLLGYDHSSAEEEKEMWTEQEKIIEIIKQTPIVQ